MSVNCVWWRFTFWHLSVQFVRGVECICRRLCHQLVPQGAVAAASLKAAASNRAVRVTDGPRHDVWLLLSSHRPALVVFGQVTSASCASHRVPGAPLCLGINMIHGTTWQTLSDGPHCPWDGNQILLGLFQLPLQLDTLLSRVGIYALYICSVHDRVQCEVMQNYCCAGISGMQNTCTLAFIR